MDGTPVDLNGSAEVLAEEGKVVTLIVNGPNNSSIYNLSLETYLPEANGLKIITASSDYSNGLPTTLYSKYLDQGGLKMTENYLVTPPNL